MSTFMAQTYHAKDPNQTASLYFGFFYFLNIYQYVCVCVVSSEAQSSHYHVKQKLSKNSKYT